MKPEKYTWTEGGEWRPWPLEAGEPPISFYSKRARDSVWHYAQTELETWGWAVHSLLTPQGHRWDCINGWTGKVTW